MVIAQMERPDAPTMMTLVVAEPLTKSERVARRRNALGTLDALIAPRLRSLLPRWLAFAPLSAGLTVYDAILSSAPATGGHWDIAARWINWFTHSVSSYSVLLDFDEQEAPAQLRVRGRSETCTDDLSPSGIESAFARAAQDGPLRTSAAHAFTGISL